MAMALRGWMVWVLACFGALYAYLAWAQPLLYNPDFFAFASRAGRLAAQPTLPDLVDGLYPLGYPLLLGWLTPLAGGWYLVAAKALSVVSAVLGLWCCARIAARLGFSPGLQLAAVLLVGATAPYLQYAWIEGTDMPATALLLLALWQAVIYVQTAKPAHALGGGLTLGAAYLVRYTALLWLPAFAVAWLVCAYIAWLKNKADNNAEIKQTSAHVVWVGLALTLGGFLLLALPQLYASYSQTGSPLYNTQHYNIWFGMYGNGQWQRIATEAVRYKNAAEVIALNPALFAKTWARQLVQLCTTNTLQMPLWFLAWPGAAAGLLGLGRHVRRAVLVIILATAAYMVAISAAFLSQRVLLILIPCQVLLGLCTVAWLRQKLLPLWQRRVELAMPLLALLLSLPALLAALPPGLGRRPDYRRIVADKLIALGKPATNQVMAFGYAIYDPDSPILARYQLPWTVSPVPIQTDAELLWLCVSHGCCYAVFDAFSGNDVPGLATFWQTRLFGPAWVGHLTQDPFLYEVRPDVAARFVPATPADFAAFATARPTEVEHPDLYLADSAAWQERVPPSANYINPKSLSAWRRWKGEHLLR